MSFDPHRSGALSHDAPVRPHAALSPSDADDAVVPGSARTPDELALQVWLALRASRVDDVPGLYLRVRSIPRRHGHSTRFRLSLSVCLVDLVFTPRRPFIQAARDAVHAAETSLAAVNARHAAASARSVEVRVEYIPLDHLVQPLYNHIVLL